MLANWGWAKGNYLYFHLLPLCCVYKILATPLVFLCSKKICRLENFKTYFMKRIVFLDQFEEGSNFHSIEA